jgi:hypothetical protein
MVQYTMNVKPCEAAISWSLHKFRKVARLIQWLPNLSGKHVTQHNITPLRPKMLSRPPILQKFKIQNLESIKTPCQNVFHVAHFLLINYCRWRSLLMVLSQFGHVIELPLLVAYLTKSSSVQKSKSTERKLSTTEKNIYLQIIQS